MILIALGRFIQYALLLITLRVSSTLLVPTELGKVSLIVSTVGFFALFLINPIGMFINRRFLNWDNRHTAKKYFRYFWFYLAVVGLLANGLVFILVKLDLWHVDFSIYMLFFLIGGNLFFGTISQTAISLLTMLGFRRWFMALTIATNLASLLLAIALVLGFSRGAQFWLSGILVGQIVVGMLGLWVFYKKLKNPLHTFISKAPQRSTISSRALLRLFQFAWPIALAVGLGWVQSQAYRYQLTASLGLSQLGLFVAGFGISSGLIAGFDSMVTTYFGPIFYRRLSDTEDQHHGSAWQDYANAVIPSLILTGFFIIAIAPELTKILLGPLFQESGIYVIWGAMAEVARTAVGVYALGAHARMNTRLLIVPNLLGAVLALILVQTLSPTYGLQGVGAALLIASLGSLLASIMSNKNHIVVTLSLKQIIKAILLGCFLLLIAGVVAYSKILQGGIFYSFGIAVIVGIIFLGAQWYLLYDYIANDDPRGQK
ncbi:hypothetical protein G6696_01610 [Polynucleobacter paneuropaeus]|jgi:O-antigen/teichoic acid export membrane protein|nr:hypothetical protein G6696_01610 [Polynucleobacter paneuropaeus]